QQLPDAPCTISTFSNTAPIVIPASGTSGVASPYPSNIVVSGMAGTITNLSVHLYGFTHQHPRDVDIFAMGPLTGPEARSAIIMSDAGGYAPVNNLDLYLTDSLYYPAYPWLIYLLPAGNPMFSDVYHPANHIDCEEGPFDQWPAPAPDHSGGSALAQFNG